MPRVFQLGYVAMAVADFAKTRDYYVDTLGTTEVDTGEDGSLYLSVGYNHHDIVLCPATEKSLLHLGFHLNPGTGLQNFARDARDHGLTAELKTDAQPGIPELVEIAGPDGSLFHFYEEMATPAPGFKAASIAPVRLGHVAVITPEAEKLIAFYRDFLGFWETDWVGGVATFMTCNHDHHVVNILNAPASRIHHVAFQLHENAYHSRAADLLRAADIPTRWGPSRHTAGHNLAAYHYDPDNTMIELYTDLDIYLPELDMFQPRPWHEHLPMKPRYWGLDQISAWAVDFDFDLARG